ncbi:hypothetical protein [Proteiniborus sp. MB09-C3]|uniref:hypothetical protein n=1 Tax=Proteiniborus sp. MB09-C3 TaxID=3050072 RepID=UPI002552CFCB|nr:hypothetical protein [Proteiniborus sp. MB09-C3]WIV10450.1 hypothetical protein QO263_09770 [Proteiniborus sp. MB09-C3]
MRNTIKVVKRLVSEMESYIYCNNCNKVNQLADELLKATNMIKEQCANTNKYGNNYTNKVTFNEYPGFSLISTLPFLYKPIEVKNYYDGDYLEKFSGRRTDDLKRAGALELHNKFWMSNNVEGGNIFGSVPLELIRKDSAKTLLSYGWKKADVSIYEIEEGISLRELDRICSINFKNYIIATEMRNSTKLVLNFDI